MHSAWASDGDCTDIYYLPGYFGHPFRSLQGLCKTRRLPGQPTQANCGCINLINGQFTLSPS